MEKNLGHATAYGYAKSKGYSGTEEEFAELMADYASVGQSAAESAEQAAASATSASGSATTASQAAQTATDKASEAVTAADTATTKASEASQSASTASTAATSASTSAQTATTAATTATTKASEASESATTATAAKTDAETARDAAAQSASEAANSAIEAAQSAQSVDAERLNRVAFGSYVTESASGSIASFADGADNIPMKDVLVHIDPVQEGSGDPSPDNVRPITGWTGAKVTRTGKNLLNPTLASGTHTGRGITWTLNNDGSVTASGTATASSYLWLYGEFSKPIPPWIHKLAGKTVTASTGNGHFTQSGYASIQVLLYGSPTFIIREETATIPSDLSPYTGFAVVLFANTGNTVDTTVYPQIELGSTATDYEPYSGDTYDVTFPSESGTVYGGQLNVTTGELTVDRAIVVIDGVNKTVRENGITSMTSNAWFPGAVGKAYGRNNCISDRFATGIGIAPGGMSGRDNSIDVEFLLPTDIPNNSTALNQWFADNPTQLCYELATPITYQLTPQEITSLLGTNNLWADTGDSEVEYRVDTAMYISRLTEPDADMIADSNITSGQYFMVGNNLYRATSNIASGASVVVGTNAVKVSLATALNEINQ